MPRRDIAIKINRKTRLKRIKKSLNLEKNSKLQEEQGSMVYVMLITKSLKYHIMHKLMHG